MWRPCPKHTVARRAERTQAAQTAAASAGLLWGLGSRLRAAHELTPAVHKHSSALARSSAEALYVPEKAVTKVCLIPSPSLASSTPQQQQRSGICCSFEGTGPRCTALHLGPAELQIPGRRAAGAAGVSMSEMSWREGRGFDAWGLTKRWRRGLLLLIIIIIIILPSSSSSSSSSSSLRRT